jgi:hypothetical protein
MSFVLVIGRSWLVLDMRVVSTAPSRTTVGGTPVLRSRFATSHGGLAAPASSQTWGFAVAPHRRYEEARKHEAGIRPWRPPAEVRGMDISSMVILAVAVVVAAIALTLDDPIGEELDRIRSRNQLRALLTPLFHRAD